MFGLASLTLDEKRALLPASVPFRRVVHEMPWLKRALVETPHAIERFRVWVADGGLDQAQFDIRERVAYFGDPEMLAPVVDALSTMAPPARDHVLATTIIIGAGWSSQGWTGAIPKAASTRSEIIVLSGASRDEAIIRRVTLHEAAHGWLEPDTGDLIRATCGENLKALAEAGGWKTQLDEHVDVIEARAEWLAATWNERREQ